MKLVTKFAVLFAMVTAITAVILFAGVNTYVRSYVEIQMEDTFRTLAENSAESYGNFLQVMEVRGSDWSSDGTIRNLTEQLVRAPSSGRAAVARALGDYLRTKKLPLDKSVVIVDVIGEDGAVIASSENGRIGSINELDEEKQGFVRFTEALHGQYGDAFVGGVAVEKEEGNVPMYHVTTPLFSVKEDSSGNPMPLHAVLLIHFANVSTLKNVIVGRDQAPASSMTSLGTLFGRYNSIDTYLVNKDHLMVTPSRFSSETILRQKVDTVPVEACFNKHTDVSQEYTDYMGGAVLGASRCLDGGREVLIVEAKSSEVFAPLASLQRGVLGGVLLIFIVIVVSTVAIAAVMLRGLQSITAAAEKVSANDLSARAAVETKDEIGILAQSFNKMLDDVEKSQQELHAAKTQLQEVNSDMRTKLVELEKFKALTIGRELKMIELKEKMKELEEKLAANSPGGAHDSSNTLI
ncbi:MAG TPA: HAMP domain-containing protein [Candidatus Paceibacterota bacterium]